MKKNDVKNKRKVINMTKVQKTAKLSIVVPCCNVEKYIEQCMDSIVNQTLKDIEIICVNDGSKDKTLELLNKYAEKDARVKVIDKPNSGYGDSMNKGFAMATGKYIGIVESDDFIEPDMFEKLYKAAEENDVDVVKCNFWFYWSEPEKTELHEYFKEEECNQVIKPLEFDNGSLFGRKPSIWSAIYKRDFLVSNDIKFLPTPGASFQDTSFTFKVYSSAKRMYCLYDALHYYRQDNENSSVNNADKKAYCICDEYNEIKKYIEKHPENASKLNRIYGAAFYDTCIWMYERLSTKMRYPYLCDMSKWFTEILDTIGIDNLDFGDAWWKRRDIERISNNPYEYHMWRNEERYDQIGSTFEYKQTITPINNYKAVREQQQKKVEKPFFSIIIPIYNNEKYLRSCLDSMLFQTFENIEVICVNDGSTDHSLSVIEEYAQIDSRIVIINKVNGGPAETRNMGIAVATGKYILFLDSDDYYAENACERVYAEIQNRNNPDAVIFGTNLFPVEPKASEWHYSVLHTPDIYYEAVDDMSLLTVPYLKIYSWRCCFKNDFIIANKLKFNADFKYGEDALFMFEAVVKFKGVAVISDLLYNYRHFSPGSLMNEIQKDYVVFAKEQLRILRQLLLVSSANGINASAKLFEYCCDFIFDSINNCPFPEKEEYVCEFVKIVRKFKLDLHTTEASENSQGFWGYCVDMSQRINRERSFKVRARHFVAKIVGPSRKVFYQHSARLTEQINMQQNTIICLQNQLNQMQEMIRAQQELCMRTEWNSREIIKKYNDDKLWQIPNLIDKVNCIEKVLDTEVNKEDARKVVNE